MRGAMTRAILLFLMAAGPIGCAEPKIAPAIDLSERKCPPVRSGVIAELNSRPPAPDLPATRRAIADWVDRLRLDSARKRALGWELVKHVAQCRAPIMKTKTTWQYGGATLLAGKGE